MCKKINISIWIIKKKIHPIVIIMVVNLCKNPCFLPFATPQKLLFECRSRKSKPIKTNQEITDAKNLSKYQQRTGIISFRNSLKYT